MFTKGEADRLDILSHHDVPLQLQDGDVEQSVVVPGQFLFSVRISYAPVASLTLDANAPHRRNIPCA